LLVSLLALLLNMLFTAIAAHLLRPKRHLYLFAISSFAWGVVYVILFLVTPPDLYFLSPAWMINESWLDLVYGLILYFLNCHTFVDCFFATCGGFSVSLLLAISKQGQNTPSTEDLLAQFKLQPQSQPQGMVPGLDPVDGTLAPEESDRIYAWRVSHLEKRGYIHRDNATKHYTLTAKGRTIALITLALKRLMNLGEGG